MKLSEKWLRRWVNPAWDLETLTESLSLAGLEVDGIEPAAPEFSKVVVAEVKEVVKHPEADKLNITQVDAGTGELIQIVCGAPNVAVGQKVPCALVGAVLPGNFKIKDAKLRGVESSGMLCSGDELGLAQDYDGLMLLPADAQVGVDLREYLDLDDNLIEIDLTPNRADCLSVRGLARDLAVISKTPFTADFEAVSFENSKEIKQQVGVAEPDLCPKYLGCVVEGFNNQATTPTWMQQRLERSGVRPISLVVDITNYVLLELGQPMHAFDADKLQGQVGVRLAKAGETLVTLDEKELKLDDKTLVIADDSGAIALAGVMGGLATSVTDSTTRLFFECAHFTPLAVAGKARSYGLHTDSSHRFERGVDFNLPEEALNRALALLTEIAGGEVYGWDKQLAKDYEPKVIALRHTRLNKLLGAEIPADFVAETLTSLGCELETTAEGWQVTAPSFRFDMQIEEDLVEEIARIYGYDNLKQQVVSAPLELQPKSEAVQDINLLRQTLVQRGYHEVVTYSFVAEADLQKLNPDHPYLSLTNPISEEMKAMRTSLLPGLLETLSYNQNRQQNRVRIFETGATFFPEKSEAGIAKQVEMLGGLISGTAKSLSWANPERKLDFYDLKGDVEQLLSLNKLNKQVRFKQTDNPALHPGQSAKIMLEDKVIGELGQLHPKWIKEYDLQAPVFVFQLELDYLMQKPVPKAGIISRFPSSSRDLAFIVAETVTSQEILDAIYEVKNPLLKDVILFDVYQGQGVAEGHKSLALSLRLEDANKTLADEEVEALIQKIIQQVADKTGAKLR